MQASMPLAPASMNVHEVLYNLFLCQKVHHGCTQLSLIDTI
jgi:hypothetical protein